MTSASVTPEMQQENPDSHHFRQHMGRVTGHSAVFFLGTIFNAITAYGFKIYLAHTLGARLLGIYAMGMTVVGIVSVFNSLGISQTAVRFVSSYTATQQFDLLRGFLGRSIFLLLICNVFLAIAMLFAGPWIAVHFYRVPDLAQHIKWFTWIMIVGVFTAFFGHVLVGYKHVARRTIINSFIGTPATIILTVVFISAGFGLKGYLAAQVLSGCLVLFFLGAVAWRLTPRPARSFHGSLASVDKETVSVAGTTLGLALLSFVMTQAETVALGRFRDPHALGIYALSSAIVAFVCIVLSSVNQIFGPTVADLYAREQHDLLSRMYHTLTKWIIGLTLPLAAVIMIFALPIMQIFGHEFEPGWIVLVIGTVSQLANAGVGSSGTLLYMTGRHRYLIRIQAGVSFMIVILNLLLVPRWGIAGAAWAGAIANATVNICYLVTVRRVLGLFPYDASYFRLLLPGTGMLFVLLIMRGTLSIARPAWAMLGISLLLAYGVFVGLALVFGLNADDKLIAQMIRARIQSVIFKTEVNA
ncbi:MAG TPA: oligosaccharide flippase family protein [Terriglobales bacterium]|nr:oligosaccharide flippase family protein [Terriglobales bacterium]